MAGALEAMNSAEIPPIEPQWAEARDRVHRYLAAHGVVAPLLDELAGQIIVLARDRAAAEPERHPSSHAIESAIALIDGWIDHIVSSEQRETPGRRFAHERASVHLAQIPRLWPQHFLSAREVPAELAAHLKETYVQAGPDLEFSNMAPRPIDLGPVSDVAGSTWRTLDKLPMLRALAIWTVYIALLALAFAAVRP
jgi:hypothetical protein